MIYIEYVIRNGKRNEGLAREMDYSRNWCMVDIKKNKV